VASRSTFKTERGLKRRLRRPLRFALGDGSLLDLVNRGLASTSVELSRRQNEVLEPEFESYLARCAPYSMTSRERLYSVFQATRYVVEAGVPGDIVECGVWRGGSSMMAALTLLGLGDTDRRFWLYDTFEGMPAPGAEDVDLQGENAYREWNRNQCGDINEWCYAPLDEVRSNLLGTGLGEQRFELVEGTVEETIPARAPEKIALLRLDTDWYESTYHELVHLCPRLSPGGVLILDDYGYWGGARKAVDRYMHEQGTTLLLNRIDSTGRLAIWGCPAQRDT
jgi:O-methyltransferase